MKREASPQEYLDAASDFDFGPVSAGRISGVVVSARFRNVDVSTLVTLTPEEYEDMAP